MSATPRSQKQMEYQRAWRERDPLAYMLARRKERLKRYGLTLQDYAVLFVLQEGRCAICREEPRKDSPRTRVLHVDHDHETGRVRALLCKRCNTVLGQAREDPDLLRSIADYAEAMTRLRNELRAA